MSVPLDKLYDFLYSLVNRSVVIYRWFPHGSKKLNNLMLLHQIPLDKWHDTPLMFCHDQEPLDYYFYTADDIEEYFYVHCSDLFSNLKQAFTNIRGKNIRAIGWDNLYDLAFLTHSEKNSDQVELYESNGFVPVYIWSHGLIARDWYRYAEHDLNLGFSIEKIRYDFLVYSRAWSGTREYRLKFMEQLVVNNLHNCCLTSFSTYDSGAHYLSHKLKNQAFAINCKDLETYFLPNQATADSSADYSVEDYLSCGIEVVLETLFDDTRWHLTEKSLRPIACGMPFMLAATAGSLAYLRSYGFKTFSNDIDESYDLISNPQDRLVAILKEMQRISKLPISQKQTLWSRLRTNAQYNKEHFFSKAFQDQVISEFVQNFDLANSKMQQSTKGKHREEFAKFFLPRVS